MQEFFHIEFHLPHRLVQIKVAHRYSAQDHQPAFQSEIHILTLRSPFEYFNLVCVFRF